MKHSVSHDLGQEKAVAAAKAAFAAYAERFAKYEPRADWVSESRANISFKAKGIALKGAIDVTPSSIDMDLDVPFLLRAFKGTALSAVEKEIQKWVGKARSGDL